MRRYFIYSFLFLLVFSNCKKDEKVTYTLHVKTSKGGNVDFTQGEFEKGEMITLTATPDTFYSFIKWSGDVNSIDNPLNLLMDSDKTITSEFAINGKDCDFIYLDANGVTIKACSDASLGDTSTINGKLYTVVDETILRNAVKNGDDVSCMVTTFITNMSDLFKDKQTLNQDIRSWDVSKVTDMSGMFIEARSFDQDISKWNVSNVTTMRLMFYNAKKFNQDINIWNVSKVVNMECMFYGAASFNKQIDCWVVSNVASMSAMFAFSNFNQDISNWNVINVTDMSYMFQAIVFFNQDISNWNVCNVTDMSYMFWSDEVAFNQDLSTWNVAKVTNMEGMFYRCLSFNQDLSNWKVRNVSNCDNFFGGAINWTKPKPNFTNCTY